MGASTDTYGYVGQSETTFALAGGASTRLSAFDLGGSRLSVKDGSTVGYLVPDLHGSVVATEGAGSSAIASALRYDGYGRTAAVALPGGTVALDTRYTGALDLSPDSTPLYDIGARLYSPASGAWTQLDTYGGQAQAPASMNRFLYAHANPTTFIDPTGHRIEGPRSGEYEVGTTEDVIERYQDQTPGAGGGTTGGGRVYRPDPGIRAVPDGGVTDGGTSEGWSRAEFDANLIDAFADITATYKAGCATVHVFNARSCMSGEQALLVEAAFWADQAVLVTSVVLDAWVSSTPGSRLGPAGNLDSTAPGPGVPRLVATADGAILDVARIRIARSKLGYLLSNRSKAGVFSDSLGYDESSLDPALRGHLLDHLSTATRPVPVKGGGEFKIQVQGPLTGPSGQTWDIVSVWAVDGNGTVRLITATPPS